MPEVMVIAVMGLLTLVVLWAGYRLKRKGQPYPGLLLNLHKLLALGIVVWIAVTVFEKNVSLSLSPDQMWVRTGMVVLAAAAIVSGGLRSIPKPIPAWIGIIHNVVPYLAIAGSGYFLMDILFR